MATLRPGCRTTESAGATVVESVGGLPGVFSGDPARAEVEDDNAQAPPPRSTVANEMPAILRSSGIDFEEVCSTKVSVDKSVLLLGSAIGFVIKL